MTRETKIGLLVGLAFIIVIGILLSDHLTSSTEPPPATLANAGNTVLQTVNTPGSSTAAQARPLSAPDHVQPDRTVPTIADLEPRPQPVQIVQVGPGGSQQTPPITIQSQSDPAAAESRSREQSAPIVMTPQQMPRIPDYDAPNDAPLITHAPAPVESALAHVAEQTGERLVRLDSSGRAAADTTPPTWTQALTGGQEYKAEAGDSVSRMAQKFYGSNTKTHRDAIVAANPSLQKNPDRVIVGHTYMIPSPREVASATARQPQPQQQPAQPRPVPTSTGETVASATEYWYTVKENDSLWKIAQEQLGNAGAVAAIKELNQIQDENRIFVGMKIKLPGKPLASAN